MLLAAAQHSAAEFTHPKPVAVRWWGQGMVSVETFGNLTVVIDPYGGDIGYDLPELSADLVLVTHEHADHNNVGGVGGGPVIVRGLNDAGAVRELHHLLDRPPTTSKVIWRSNTKADSAKTSKDAVGVRSVSAWHDERQGADRGATAVFSIVVDGVNIVHCGDLGQSKLTDSQVAQLGTVDVLILSVESDAAVTIVEQLNPRYVVPIHYKTDRLKIPLEPIDSFLAAVGDRWEVDRPVVNTLAVSAADGDDETSTRVVVLGYEPWRPSGELAALMDRMQSAGEASQGVFAKLSQEQMSWRPPNGSHTPRWNAEHMTGRQLGFFSQIYAALDPEIAAIDLNPAQMPDKYRPAHPDWDGAEEARQMERSAAFVRRFAYLLDGVDPDARAPGSRWTLRRLLQQMERHYGEHTANVQKKFELEGWPAG
ncbi:MBL fold metallo-hydrolase [Pirellulimonas nuda]|nr:MBL fold metallo-hydrolase [Pirellulimonas nuda]